MIEITAYLLLGVGHLFVFVGALGVFRFEDVYLRLQASSKALTFGFGAIVLAAGLLSGDPIALGKAVLALAFQFLTAPIAATVIARTAIRAGVEMKKLAPPKS